MIGEVPDLEKSWQSLWTHGNTMKYCTILQIRPMEAYGAHHEWAILALLLRVRLISQVEAVGEAGPPSGKGRRVPIQWHVWVRRWWMTWSHGTTNVSKGNPLVRRAFRSTGRQLWRLVGHVRDHQQSRLAIAMPSQNAHVQRSVCLTTTVVDPH